MHWQTSSFHELETGMKAKHLLTLSVIFSLFFISNVQSARFPNADPIYHCIDLSHVNMAYQFGYVDSNLAYGAFNGAPEISLFVNMLRCRYNIHVAIETGSLYGHTAAFLASIFNQVHTIEIVPTNYQVSQNTLYPFPNAVCHLGSSQEVLKELLPLLKEKSLFFYLDAHWNEYWPLLDELEEISKTHKDNCIIVIDDIKVPGRPDIAYDAYAEHECSYEYVRNAFDKIYSSYDYYFVLPRNLGSKAKLVVFPRNWSR